MSRLPRVADRSVLRALLRAGFEIKRIRGSHHHLVDPVTGRRVTVPVHGEILAPKTLLSILDQAGLTPEEFTRLLE